jgi:hypothetical protein
MTTPCCINCGSEKTSQHTAEPERIVCAACGVSFVDDDKKGPSYDDDTLFEDDGQPSDVQEHENFAHDNDDCAHEYEVYDE